MKITKEEFEVLLKSSKLTPLIKETIKDLLKEVLIEEGLKITMQTLSEALVKNLYNKPSASVTETVFHEVFKPNLARKNQKASTGDPLEDAIDDALSNNPTAVQQLLEERSMTGNE